jgi:hypothetical protein
MRLALVNRLWLKMNSLPGKGGQATYPASEIFWLRDESLEPPDNLPDPDVLAQEIVEDLEAALE